jgi:hypothetical protein
VTGLELLHLLFGFFLLDAVALLDTPDELVALAFDTGQIVIGQLAPLFLDLALELIPIALGRIPIHVGSFIHCGGRRCCGVIVPAEPAGRWPGSVADARGPRILDGTPRALTG